MHRHAIQPNLVVDRGPRMHHFGRRLEKSEIQKRRRKPLQISRIGEKLEGLGHWPPHDLRALECSNFHRITAYWTRARPVILTKRATRAAGLGFWLGTAAHKRRRFRF